MKDEAKTKAQLIAELGAVRQRVAELEALIVEQAPIREQLQQLIEQLPIGIQIFDTSGQCIDANAAHLHIFGVDQAEQLIGKYNLFTDPMAEKTGTQAAGRQALMGDVVHLLEVPFDFSQANPAFADKEYGRRTISVTFFPVRNSAGEIIQIVALNEDVTERNKAIEALQKSEEHLHQAQRMEAVGQLAGGIAHNFNNMLTAIMGYTGLSLETLPANHPATSDLQGIQKTAERAAKLVQQLLAFTRSQIVQPQILNMNELILSLKTTLRQLISEDIELVISLASDLGQINMDPGQFEQVIVNLILNARDAMPAGGKLTLETANVTLGQEYANQYVDVAPGDYVILAVSDTGSGMAEEVQQHIFEPFFTTKDVGQGTGLGLATCFGIVKQNNGHIAVYSEPEQGTTFKVYLPRLEETPVKLSQSNQSEYLPTGDETIFIVEDEVTVREMAARILHQQGYTILMAANGEKALELITEQAKPTIHLLITDVIMPRMGGKMLADKLKDIYPSIKVLYISGYTDNAIVHHGVLEPGINFLPKPFTPNALVRKVRGVLDETYGEPLA